MRYDLNMLDRVTETPVIQATATCIEDYDCLYDSPIYYDVSSHAHETGTDKDTTDSFSSDLAQEPALSHHTSDNNRQYRPQEQGYLMLNGTRTWHP